MAPEGKSSVTGIMYSDYEFWEKLYEDRDASKAEKKKIADELVSII